MVEVAPGTGGRKGEAKFFDDEIEWDTQSIARRAPGRVERALFCDESGIAGNQKHYGFGALIMGYQRRGDFARAMAQIRAQHRFSDDELKWNKISRGNRDLYLALVDYFFRTPWLFFHCMLVERAWVQARAYHHGSFELARSKHFTQFLTNKVGLMQRVHRGRDLWIRVYADKIPSSYSRAAETIHIIGNRAIKKLDPLATFARDAPGPIDSVIECDSKAYNGIQLSDLLLGAVLDTWNEGSSSEHKAAVKARIASYLGWPDLKADTHPSERKFNVWWLTDRFHRGEERPVKSRSVRLVHHLPPIKRYRRA